MTSSPHTRILWCSYGYYCGVDDDSGDGEGRALQSRLQQMRLTLGAYVSALICPTTNFIDIIHIIHIIIILTNVPNIIISTICFCI